MMCKYYWNSYYILIFWLKIEIVIIVFINFIIFIYVMCVLKLFGYEDFLCDYLVLIVGVFIFIGFNDFYLNSY